MALIDRDYMGGNPKSDTNIEDEIRRRRDAEIYETIIPRKTRTKYPYEVFLSLELPDWRKS